MKTLFFLLTIAHFCYINHSGAQTINSDTITQTQAESSSRKLNSLNLLLALNAYAYQGDKINNNKTCAESNNFIHQDLSNLNPEKFDLIDVSKKSLKLIKKSFALRIKIKNKYDQIKNKNLNCINATRNVLASLRFFEDYIGFSAQVQRFIPKDSDLPAGTIFNDEYHSHELKSGDVIISRGNAYSSASIARITDVGSQFSHLSILYIDPKSKKKFVIESHVERGTTITPWKKYLGDGKIRAYVVRTNDENFAAEAAQKIYDYVIKYQADHDGETIPYDFNMDTSDHSRLFCSELVQFAYELASEGKFVIPEFKSPSSNNNVVKNSMGLDKNKEFFSPADMEVDSRFHIVAEFRNFEIINQGWNRDAVLSFLYDQWNKKKMTLRYSLLSKAAVLLAKSLRTTFVGEQFLDEYVPLVAPKEGYLVMTVLNVFLGSKIDQWIEQINLKNLNDGHPLMTYNQLHKYLIDNQDVFAATFASYLSPNK